MVLAINSKEKSRYCPSLRPSAVMQSVPGADRGPRAGSPRGVVDATGSRFTGRSSLVSQHPVAIAPGTDLITVADLLTWLEDIAFTAL
jgi:hypothetical protein